VEVAIKAAIEKPELHRTKDGAVYHLQSFDHSFPSGHAMRAVLVAALLLSVWRRLGLVAAAWAAIVPGLLVIASWHGPPDVAGRVVLGLVAVGVTIAVIAAVAPQRE